MRLASRRMICVSRTFAVALSVTGVGYAESQGDPREGGPPREAAGRLDRLDRSSGTECAPDAKRGGPADMMREDGRANFERFEGLCVCPRCGWRAEPRDGRMSADRPAMNDAPPAFDSMREPEWRRPQEKWNREERRVGSDMRCDRPDERAPRGPAFDGPPRRPGWSPRGMDGRFPPPPPPPGFDGPREMGGHAGRDMGLGGPGGPGGFEPRAHRPPMPMGPCDAFDASPDRDSYHPGMRFEGRDDREGMERRPEGRERGPAMDLRFEPRGEREGMRAGPRDRREGMDGRPERREPRDGMQRRFERPGPRDEMDMPPEPRDRGDDTGLRPEPRDERDDK